MKTGRFQNKKSTKGFCFWGPGIPYECCHFTWWARERRRLFTKQSPLPWGTPNPSMVLVVENQAVKWEMSFTLAIFTQGLAKVSNLQPIILFNVKVSKLIFSIIRVEIVNFRSTYANFPVQGRTWIPLVKNSSCAHFPPHANFNKLTLKLACLYEDSCSSKMFPVSTKLAS